jgi:hypothetical protein
MKYLAKLALIPLIFVIAGASGCKTRTGPEPGPIYSIEVTKPNQDTVFVVENNKPLTQFSISYQSTLSGIAGLICSADTLFQNHSGFAVSAGSPSKGIFYVGDFKEKLLFIKYQPISDSLSGSLKINVQSQ